MIIQKPLVIQEDDDQTFLVSKDGDFAYLEILDDDGAHPMRLTLKDAKALARYLLQDAE